MRTAIVYDRVNKWGGAESLLLALHEIFPQAPLYTAVYFPNKAMWAKVFPSVYTSFLQKIPFIGSKHELLGTLTPIAFETFNFDEYDLVISVTSEAAKGIITKPQTKHLCICLTPTRYLWSGYDEYRKNIPKSLSWIPFFKVISKPFLSYVKSWDKVASSRPDQYVAISSEVQDRIIKYYKRNSIIIFPPVDTDKFSNPLKNKMSDADLKPGSYYLIVSRLVPYKKVDLAIKAFNTLGEKLVVVGTGSEESTLKNIAKKNIKMMGFVDEKKLIELYIGAKAFIFPQEEDFGITAVEAQAAGVPVIAYKKGGAVDTVIDGKTGVFFEKQTTKSLIEAVNRFKSLKFENDLLIKNAERFSKENFKKEIKDLIAGL